MSCGATWFNGRFYGLVANQTGIVSCETDSVNCVTVQICVGDCAWDLQNPSKLEKVLTTGGHDSAVVAVAWQPAGNGLTTCDRNKTVVVWADI